MQNRKLVNGIYEELISTDLDRILKTINDDDYFKEKIDKEEAPNLIASYVAKAIKQGLLILNDSENGLENQTLLANQIIELIKEKVAETDAEKIKTPAEQLKTVLSDKASHAIKIKAKDIVRPETPISYTSLFTGAQREPRLDVELAKEIMTADRIDFLVSFIRWSGINLIMDELREFTESGKKLRIITTSYMGVTEVEAIQKLALLPNTEIRVSYEPDRSRLHAKSYIFYRDTDYSTAYVGSSNLSSAAMTSGCEWNVKLTKTDLPDVFDKIAATFEAYWHSKDYEEYNYEILKNALENQKNKGKEPGIKRVFYCKPELYKYQEAILDRLTAEREIHHSYKNLIVAATGTGKTIISAFDYKRQCEKAKRKLRLLFVAHRKEILEQSIECFREVLNDSQFAELFVGDYKPSQYNFLFVSISMLNSREFQKNMDPNQYEYIVLDECHHVAAQSYQKSVMQHFTPKYLIGLTATPERMDGESILPCFNNRIAAEIRLPEAINRKLLCPFQYFCIEDSVPLKDVKWSRGGYEISELENLYVFTREVANRRAKTIYNSMIRYIADLDSMKGLVFCVSVSHAKFMSEFFNNMGIPTKYLTAQSAENERERTKISLESGEIKLVCVVDLYNEGVDIKTINTVLFLRPTESLTVYLQQLGRGLRIADGKDCLTVLDFIGQANKKYRFENKFNALLQSHGIGLRKEIDMGFPSLPRGCYIKLEGKTKEYILNSIRNSISTENGLKACLMSFEDDTGMKLSVENFLNYYSIHPRMLYGQHVTITEYRKINSILSASDEEIWKKLYRISTINSIDLLDFYIDNITALKGLSTFPKSPELMEYWRLLYSTLIGIEKEPDDDNQIIAGLQSYWQENLMFIDELEELLRFNRKNIELIGLKETLPYHCLLDVYCEYTRAQVLAALDCWKVSSEGVARISDKKTTCLFITLNKSNNFYSPSTTYHDYSISDELFHWQTQNSTSEWTEVGQRYIHHVELNETILLFVREAKEDKYGAVPFTFLGKGTYVGHDGNKPMSIIWKLDHPIPANFIDITDKLGVV